MTRRILFMLIGFTAIVLVGAVVPLTLNATSHDRNSFIQAAAGTARTDAAVAQPRLDQLAEPEPSAGSAVATAQAMSAILTAVLEARQAGDGLLVLTSVTNSWRQPAGRACGHAGRQLGSARHAGG